jgi:hypothetical protein
MTRDEAKDEAIRRWGSEGMIFDRIDDCASGIMGQAIERVGRYWVGRDYIDHGNGNSWEDAFDARDAKQFNRMHP